MFMLKHRTEREREGRAHAMSCVVVFVYANEMKLLLMYYRSVSPPRKIDVPHNNLAPLFVFFPSRFWPLLLFPLGRFRKCAVMPKCASARELAIFARARRKKSVSDIFHAAAKITLTATA